VAEALQYAIKNNLPVAVKSGGHSMEGFSCNNGGMVINLSLLNKVEWLNKETIKVGPGCTLANLYANLLPRGKIIPGGSCGNVGIGGLTLGGGYGLLSRKFGLTCDSLQQVTMVDGRGIVRNSNTEKDLLWACRGGGNGSIGVITEMVFGVHKAPAGMQSFRFKAHNTNPAKAKSIFKEWFVLTKNLPVNSFSACLLNGKTVYILLTNTDKDNSGIQNIITAFSALTDKTTHSLYQPLANALKVYYSENKPIAFKNASAGLYRDFTEIEPFLEEVLHKVNASPGMIYQVNTLGGNIINAGFEAASCFAHRSCYYFSELQSYWENDRQAAKRIENFDAVQGIFLANGISTQYCNYPDINFKDWETQYYGKNYRKLQNIKYTYDPFNIIRHEQSIRPLKDFSLF
jgi:FAD binding domain/Berberine and berberine like